MGLHVGELGDGLVTAVVDIVHAFSEVANLEVHSIVENDPVGVQFGQFVIDFIENVQFIVRFVNHFLELIKLTGVPFSRVIQLVQVILMLN